MVLGYTVPGTWYIDQRNVIVERCPEKYIHMIYQYVYPGIKINISS